MTLRACLGLLVLAAGAALPAAARGQAAGVPIEAGEPVAKDASLLAKAKALSDAGKLLDRPKVAALLKSPEPAHVALRPPATQPLSTRELAARARQAYLRIGWYYLCPDCGHWHLNAAGGYAISADGIVATCFHCVDPGDVKGEGYLVAADSTGTVLPITTVLAANRMLDCALVRVAGGTLTPLALNADVATGDPAYLFSDPLDTRGYFSAGIVNRFYWQSTRGANPATLAGVLRLRLNVSTDWAPGSSGAAVLDACGNVIGHVSTISALHEAPGRSPKRTADEKDEPDKHAKGIRSDPLITLHEAIPARGVLLLAKSMDPPPAKP
jgi:hypothetical protein